MTILTHKIATILPPSEHFTSNAAGAIALFVRDTTCDSAYQENITVYGNNDQGVTRFPNIRYQGVISTLPALFGRNGGYARSLVQHFKKNPVSLIEVHNRVNIFNILSCNLPQVPISLYFHNDPLTIKGAKTPQERWKLLSRAGAIYCCSDYVRRRFMTGLEAARADHVHVVYEYTSTPPRAEKEKIILYVGRLIEEKGVLELAKSIQKIMPQNPDWRIIFAGASRPGGKNDTPYSRKVFELLKPLGNQALFLGHQPHNKIMGLFSRAAIAVVPSVWAEPMGRTAAEAVAAGCALITSGHGGLAEIAGTAGVIVSPVTEDGLANALQSLMESPARLKAVQDACYMHGHHFALAAGRPYFDGLRHRVLSQTFGNHQIPTVSRKASG